MESHKETDCRYFHAFTLEDNRIAAISWFEMRIGRIRYLIMERRLSVVIERFIRTQSLDQIKRVLLEFSRSTYLVAEFQLFPEFGICKECKQVLASDIELTMAVAGRI